MNAVRVDIITPVLEGWGICSACETLMAQAGCGQPPYRRDLEDYPPEWQADFRRLSALVLGLADRYGDKILIRLWDPRSLQGLVKSIRYGVRRYPTFIVAGRHKVTGWEAEKLEQSILAAGSSPSPQAP